MFLWLTNVFFTYEKFLESNRYTLCTEVTMCVSSSRSHFSTWPRALDVEMASRSATTSPSLLFMCVTSRDSVNSSVAIPSKHFFR